jgi:hypothetical protein
MTRSNDLEYFILSNFYRGTMIVYLGALCEYESIFIMLIDNNLVVNIKFIVKYSINYNI